MVSNLQILEKIGEYLYGKLNLHSFREWIVRAHLEMQAEKAKEEQVDQDAARLLAEIEGRYAEFSDEMIPEREWRGRLAALIAPVPKSAESYFLTYYYNVPSAAFQINSMNVSAPFEDTARNPINSVSNFRDPERVAA
jgi:hypothetical protein